MVKFIFITLIAIAIGGLLFGPLSSLLGLYNSSQSGFFSLLSTPFNILNGFFTSMFTYNYILTIIMYFLVIALFFYVLNSLFRGDDQ